jgi:hypothetical protein
MDMAIETLTIKDFKSIKNLKLNCKKINVFIGEPNTGKSNILEAIGLVSHICYGNLSKFVRFETMIDLFYDRDLDDKISIGFDNCSLDIEFENGSFRGSFSYRQPQGNVANTSQLFQYNYSGGGQNERGKFGGYATILGAFKFYRFEKLGAFPQTYSDFLSPPNGSNLLHIILTKKEIRRTVSDLFKKFGYRVVFKPQEGKMEVQKDLEDIIVSIPYVLSSETLQRIVFYLAAIYSNTESIISFEEPEAHAFPYYTKYLAERIALDTAKNQYFIATHNPYFLISILEKTPKDEIATFITYLEDYQTKIKLLSENDIENALAMGSDLFFNIDQFFSKDSNRGH